MIAKLVSFVLEIIHSIHTFSIPDLEGGGWECLKCKKVITTAKFIVFTFLPFWGNICAYYKKKFILCVFKKIANEGGVQIGMHDVHFTFLEKAQLE